MFVPLPSRHDQPARRGFTLIELLIVVAIIALLVSMLVPSLGRARELTRTVMCASLMRGYAMATEMYVAANRQMMMDSYNFLDSEAGIPKYWGSEIMAESVARCPADQTTETLDRLGAFPQFNDLLLSIGCNENMLSCSARMTRFGPMAFWVDRDRICGKPAELMVWADWQNNPYLEVPTYAVVKPQTGSMGSLCFRHLDNISNASFLDGHVGEMKATVKLDKRGHELAQGVNWNIPGSVPQLYKCYYPFGVGASQTDGTAGSRGLWPDMDLK